MFLGLIPALRNQTVLTYIAAMLLLCRTLINPFIRLNGGALYDFL